MTISSHEHFRRSLSAASASIDEIVAKYPEPALHSIQKQLHALEEWTRDGKMADMSQRNGLNFGLLADRYVDDLDQPLAQQLYALASYLIYWDPKPEPVFEEREKTRQETTTAHLDATEAELKHTDGWQAEALSDEAYSTTELYAPNITASKYGFKTAEDKAREEEAAKLEKAKPVLAAWEERMSATLDEQQSLKPIADEIAPKVEDVLWEWVAVNKASLTDHFITPDPFVARSENGANWAVFLHEDEEAFVSYLWCVSLTLDASQEENAAMLAVDSSRGALKDEAEKMAEILSNVTGIPAKQQYGYGPNYMDEKSLHVADLLRGSPNIPARPARPQAYYRVHGEMKYDKFFTLATNWIRLLPST